MRSMPIELAEIHDVRWRKMLALLMRSKPNYVLDIGCSKSIVSQILVQQGIEVYGLDISEEAVFHAREVGVRAEVCDVQEGLPYPDEFFDAILAGEIIEHLNDTDAFLEETRRVLRRGGRLVLTTPNLASLENRLRIVLGRQPMYVDYNSQADKHLRAYTLRALVQQVAERGYRIEAYTGSFVPPLCDSIRFFRAIRKRTTPVLSILADVWPSLAVHIIISARKTYPE